jgi:hypothetical protein
MEQEFKVGTQYGSFGKKPNQEVQERLTSVRSQTWKLLSAIARSPDIARNTDFSALLYSTPY